jgi:hypothetical protein
MRIRRAPGWRSVVFRVLTAIRARARSYRQNGECLLHGTTCTNCVHCSNMVQMEKFHSFLSASINPINKRLAVKMIQIGSAAAQFCQPGARTRLNEFNKPRLSELINRSVHSCRSKTKPFLG